MSKKGIISLEALVKLIPHLILVVVLLFGLAALYKIFIQEQEPIPAVNDLDRTVSIIKQLSPYETASVFVNAKGYSLVLHSQDSKDPPEQCGGETCLCLVMPQKTTCRVLPRIGKVCKEVSQEQCRFEPMCFVPKNNVNSVYISSIKDLIYVCRACTRIAMADSEERCQTLLKESAS